MPVDFLGLFSALNRDGVRYVLVGGLAAVLHGVDRITADVRSSKRDDDLRRALRVYRRGKAVSTDLIKPLPPHRNLQAVHVRRRIHIVCKDRVLKFCCHDSNPYELRVPVIQPLCDASH